MDQYSQYSFSGPLYGTVGVERALPGHSLDVKYTAKILKLEQMLWLAIPSPCSERLQQDYAYIQKRFFHKSSSQIPIQSLYCSICG